MQQHFSIEDYQVEVLSDLGVLTPDVHYFKVSILSLDDKPLGLLRVGSLDSGLKRELELRENLKDYGLIAKILASTQITSINSSSTPSVIQAEPETEEIKEISKIRDFIQTEIQVEPEIEETPEEILENVNSETSEESSNYLEEEHYPEKPLINDTSPEKICILSEFPSEQLTLETWLKTPHSQEESLSTVLFICQCFAYISQQQYYFVNLLPQFIEIGQPLKLFDITSSYPNGDKPTSGISGDYCAPELATGQPINEFMSSYTVAALLYQLTHQKLPHPNQINLDIQPIPRIYQLLKICLSPIPEERFPLLQLRRLLLETRNALRTLKIHWNIASNSTVGLSTERLQNEDNYGVRQQKLSDSETLLMGVVADGMGGMAQGEIASQIAVKTLLEETIPQECKTAEQYNNWLINLFQKANQAIANQVKNGGTTLSVILALNDQLMIAHVGDSRIYLLRQNQIQQLSHDHSLVAMLVANGEITPEESLTHPERNVLLRSLGSKYQLSNDYVYTKAITLESNDIILLCSDGVWDLVQSPELLEIFSNFDTLQNAVDSTIQKVLNKGASDNATLLALQYFVTLDN